ncbi:MAG TPA: DNA/RNA nuclease SfsA [Fibrobacteria bacterium]|nr:DNA/RNA nuclease SfsA [Fibrobacteria bacterium]
MKYPGPLRQGILIRRYKRFLADVRLDSGEELTAHCANPGSMLGCAVPGWPVLVSESPNPARKLKHTLESVHNGACWIGVNPALANAVAEEGIRAGAVPELAGYRGLVREARHGESTRFDFLLTRGSERCFVEVKSVTMVGADGLSAFPDAVTARGVKHIRELLAAKAAGDRAVLLFVVQRSDGLMGFRAAAEIDPLYAATLASARAGGLEAYAHWAEVDAQGIALTGTRLPWPPAS